LVAATLEGLSPFMDRPFAFFGHSMGAVLAFELTRTLRRTPGASLPSHVIVSGRQGPRAPSRFPRIAHLPDDEFLKALDERYGGIPAEVAREPELLRLLLPCIKADILSVEKHDWVEEEPLEVPITALCGTDDPTTFPEEAELWGRETTGSFALGLVPGDHFFLNTARAQVIQIVARALFAKPRSPLSVPHD
jgi:surfactin synthase thioesterase subunit